MLHTNWPIALRFLLVVHIMAGMVSLVCAPVAMAVTKGGRTHRLWGKTYFWAMAVVAATALALAVALPIWFLALVAVFSFYQAFSAYRVLFLKNLFVGGRAQSVDWMAALLTFVCSLALAIAGVVVPHVMQVGIVSVNGHPISIVSVVFGCLGMSTSSSSIRRFLHRPPEKMFWWYDHLTGMLASYIAALTAFSAVNLGPFFGTAWWVWLWPTLLGTPAIAIWNAYYRRKFARGRRGALVAA